MTRTSPWDEIDATLLTLAKAGLTLADLVAQSKLGADAVKDLVHAYVKAGWLVQIPFSPSYELALAGRARLAELDQSESLVQLTKAA